MKTVVENWHSVNEIYCTKCEIGMKLGNDIFFQLEFFEDALYYHQECVNDLLENYKISSSLEHYTNCDICNNSKTHRDFKLNSPNTELEMIFCVDCCPTEDITDILKISSKKRKISVSESN